MSRRSAPISSDIQKLIPPPDAFVATANKVLTESLSVADASYIAKQMNQLASSGAYSFFMSCDAYRAAKLLKAFQIQGFSCSTNPDVSLFPAAYFTTINIAWG